MLKCCCHWCCCDPRLVFLLPSEVGKLLPLLLIPSMGHGSGLFKGKVDYNGLLPGRIPDAVPGLTS